jgi:hypothetical protein
MVHHYGAVHPGCHIATLQSTPMAERVYAALDSAISAGFLSTCHPSKAEERMLASELGLITEIRWAFGTGGERLDP